MNELAIAPIPARMPSAAEWAAVMEIVRMAGASDENLDGLTHWDGMYHWSTEPWKQNGWYGVQRPRDGCRRVPPRLRRLRNGPRDAGRFKDPRRDALHGRGARLRGRVQRRVLQAGRRARVPSGHVRPGVRRPRRQGRRCAGRRPRRPEKRFVGRPGRPRLRRHDGRRRVRTRMRQYACHVRQPGRRGTPRCWQDCPSPSSEPGNTARSASPENRRTWKR